MINAIKQNKKAVLAFLLALVMVISIIPFTATEVHAVEVAPTAEGTEAFTRDFTLEMWSNADTSKQETHQMSYTDGAWNTVKSNILPATALAYAGNGVTVTSFDNYSVALTEDQSNEAAFNGADVMIATGTATKDDPLSLHFEHYYAKVTFNVTLTEEFEDTDEISNFYVVTKDEYVPEVIAYNSATNQYSAYVTAGTYSAGSKFLKIEIGNYTGDNRLVANIPSTGLTLAAGKHYTFNLKVGKEKVEITEVKINDGYLNGWYDEESLNGDGIIGIPDAGKDAWVADDQVIAALTSDKYGTQNTTLTYDGANWNYPAGTTFKYLEDETPTVTAVYAPSDTHGLGEYIEILAEIADGKLNVSLVDFHQTYSRLRIVGAAGQKLSVTTSGFTPAGATEEGNYSYDVTADANGNAFLYGSFAKDGTVVVTDTATGKTLIRWVFDEPTVDRKGYALFTGTVVDLNALTETYVVNDSGAYHFSGTGNYGIKVESGSPIVYLSTNSEITVASGNALDITATNSTTTVIVEVGGGCSLTAENGAGIFVAEGSTVHITSQTRDNSLTVNGGAGNPGIGGCITGNNDTGEACGNIKVSDITLYVHSKDESHLGTLSAAIGTAGNGGSGTITIDDATVYAYGACTLNDYAPSIGAGYDWSFGAMDISTPIIIRNSEVHAYRGGEYADYIGCAGNSNGASNADSAINCGDGGSVTNSTIYCYTGADDTEADKSVTYDASGNASE